MADYGMKVSRAGYDVKTCADNELLWSSSFPALSIVQSGTIVSLGTISHSLGYTPVFTTMDFSSLSFNNGVAAGFADQHANLNVSGSNVVNPSSEDKRYYLFNREIRTSYTASNINTTPTSQGAMPQDYGFKVSRDGKDVFSTNLEDFITFSGLNSGGFPIRQFIVHQSGYQDNITNGSSGTFTHNLGYVPLFMSWYRPVGATAYTPSSISISPGFNGIDFQVLSTTANIIANNNSLGYAIDFAYVIFKDPF